jgi:hypothetical protein
MGGFTPASVIAGVQQVGALTGAVSPVLSEIGEIISTFSGTDVREDAEEQRRRELRARHDLALRQLEQKQKLSQTQEAQANSLEKKKMRLEKESDERRRKAALKRAMAKRTAEFGASGTGSSGGSAQALLLGLFEESDEEREEREKLDNLKSKALDTGLANRRSINVLQRSQLAQRQQLERASRF